MVQQAIELDKIDIPIEKQRKVHDMTLSKEGFSDTVRENMQPGKNNFIYK